MAFTNAAASRRSAVAADPRARGRLRSPPLARKPTRLASGRPAERRRRPASSSSSLAIAERWRQPVVFPALRLSPAVAWRGELRRQLQLTSNLYGMDQGPSNAHRQA
jgi:hypothetical protein